MKTKLFLIAAMIVGAVALVSAPAWSDDKGGKDQSANVSPEEMAKAMGEYMRLGQPGEGHKALDALVGSWKSEMKFWPEGPQGPATISRGTQEAKWILSGRYLLAEAKSVIEMPNPADPAKPMKMPFEGMGLFGYDNFRKGYVGSWCDSMGTQFLTYKGTRNPQSGDIVCYGEMDEPYMPGIGFVVGRYVRYVWKFEGRDKYTMTAYDLHAGEDYKAFEITYTRQ